MVCSVCPIALSDLFGTEECEVHYPVEDVAQPTVTTLGFANEFTQTPALGGIGAFCWLV